MAKFCYRRKSLVTAFVSCLICCSLLFSPMSRTSFSQSTRASSAQELRGNPEPGPPVANMPNLDVVRRKRAVEPHAEAPVQSTMRGRRKPLAPRNDRKVGDPGTTGFGTTNPTQNHTVGESVRVTSAKRKSLPTGTGSATRAGSLHHARNTVATKPSAPTAINDDQYVQDFFGYALGRLPTTTGSPSEQTYWYNMVRTALNHSQSSLVLAAREMGKTLFESAEYAAQGQTNHWYVYNLYRTYLRRDPDSGGWSYWEGLVPTIGRENVRRAFDESGEFVSVVGTVVPHLTISGAVASLLTERVDPKNQPGNQMMARDTEWSANILSLPGRAGLDLGLSISYSSAATWTRSGPYIYFDEDNSSLSPGFRHGFPTIQDKFFNAQIAQDAYLLITPAGKRIELRQVENSGYYRAADSSYLQLADNSGSNPSLLLLRTPDGKQLSYSRIENEWRCKQIVDRNGNYL